MEYAKIQGAFVRGVVFREADMAARGAWATLVAFCADQENGGRIIGCTAWTDRQWLSRADCLRADVDHLTRSKLAAWGDEDLLIAGYDQVSEASFRTLAETNRRRALDGWQKRRGNAAGNGDESRRQPGDMPGAMPAADVGGAAALPAAPVADAIDRPTDRPIPHPPQDQDQGEGDDARAGEAPPASPPQAAAAVDAAGDPFTDLEERQLAWLAARGALLVNPATGELLGRQWLRLTAGLGTDLVKRILAARVGDFPSDFRKASEAFATQVEAARRGNANAEVDRVMAEAARREAAERAAQQAKLDEEQARQRGPYLEQARVLLAEIAAADPRLLVLADSGFAAALVRLRSDVAAGRVLGLNLVHIRTGWPAVRDRALPPEAPPPAPPPPPRDYTEPAAADPEPATP